MLVTSITNNANSFTVSEQLLLSFNISMDVNSLFYTGAFTIKDTDAYIIKNNFISIGSTCSLIVKDYSSTESGDVYFLPISILNITQKFAVDDGDVKIEQGGGYFIFSFISPWFFNQQIRSKAYQDKFSNIIKDLVTSSVKWKFNDVRITESDDNLYARYQTGENEKEFIEKYRNRISINGKPCYIFTTDFNDFVLSSFNDLYSKTAKGSIMPNQYRPDSEIPEPFFWYKAINTSIAENTNTVYELKEKTNIFDMAKLENKQQLVTFKPNIGGKFFLDKKVIENNNFFDMEHYTNMTPQDINAINLNAKRHIYDFMNIMVITDFLGFKATIGDPMYLYIPITSDTMSAERSALSGKYLIKKLTHMYSGGKYFSKVELIRPNIILETDALEKNLYGTT